MDKYIVKIGNIEKISQNIYKIIAEKPDGYKFIPGQFTNVSVRSKNKIEDQKIPLSFTNTDDSDLLEFIVKSWNDHGTLTKKILGLGSNDKLIISRPHGNLNYRGMGIFIAGGTGITPFISILRDLKRRRKLAGNSLIYSNRTNDNVILNNELSEMLDTNYIRLFTRERVSNFYFGRMDENFLRMQIVDFERYFYICGPSEFVNSIHSILRNFGVAEDSIIYEQIGYPK